MRGWLSSQPRLLRRVFPIAIPLVLTVLACALTWGLHQASEHRADAAGRERASQAAAVLQAEIRRENGILAGTRLLFGSDLDAAPQVASRFGPALLENAHVIAIAYAPHVAGAERPAFERRTGVRIRDLNGSGEPVAATGRQLYFPALVVMPAAQARLLGGLDAYSVPQTAAAIDRAINTGSAQTASLTGVFDADAYALVQPVYRSKPQALASARQQAAAGVVIGAFPIAALDEALTGSLEPGTGFRLSLNGQEVSRSGSLGAAGVSEFAIAGGRWRVEVARPAPDRVPALVAAFGSAGLVLLFTALFAQITRGEREREAATRAADEASAERDRTASVVASLQEGLVILDAKGRVESVNGRFCQMTGSDPGQVRGRALTDFLAETDPAQVALLRAQVARGESADIDHHLLGSDGEPFPALLSLAPFREPSGQVAGTVCTIKDISERARAEGELRASEEAYRRLAVEQGSYRRVATAVAETPDPESIYALVSEEAARMLEAEAAWVVKLEGKETVRLLGAYGADPSSQVATSLGSSVPMSPSWPVAELARTGHVARRRAGSTADDPKAFRHSIIAPIRVSGRLWGGLEIARNGAVFPPESDERLTRVAELLATAVSNAESRALLAAQASRDPLTDLANHRSFWEHLRRAFEHARRYGQPMSLVLFDIDHFKQVNDLHGHQAGDLALVETGRRLRALAREGELLARTGGEEFAWILPATDAPGALAAAERARRIVGSEAIAPVGAITLSAGVCDLSRAQDPAELFALADGALYWAKSQGRDQVVLYDPKEVKALSAEERRRKAERERVMTGLRGLAQAVDARDPATLEHSERVAVLSEALAVRVGWGPEAATRLREAALIHDVGKVGIPDAILLKPGALTDRERAKVQEHVDLSTLIAGEVLDPEQTTWVRGHHERWDGGGYPDRIAGELIPEGARILALADAWDVITTARPYKAAASPAEALAECRRSAGVHFEPRLVDVLEAHLAGGASSDTPAATREPEDPNGPGTQRERRRRPRAAGGSGADAQD